MLKFKSIRNLILICILPLVIFSMVILAVLSYRSSKSIINGELDQKMQYELNSIVKSIQKSLIRNQNIAEALGKTIESSDGTLNRDNCRLLVQNFMKTNDETFGCGIWFEPNKFDPNEKYYGPYAYRDKGNIVYTDDYNKAENDYFKNDWYKVGKNTNKSVLWSPPYIDDVNKVTMVTATVPFYDKDKKFNGVTTADINLSSLQNMIKNIKIGETGKAFLLDSNGNYIAGVDASKITKMKITNDENKNLAYLGNNIIKLQNGNESYFDGKVKNRIYYMKMPEIGWTVALTISENELFEPLKSLMIKIILLIAIIGIVTTLFIIWFSKYIRDNLKDVNIFAEAIAKGDLTQNIEIKTEDELGKMRSYLNKMNNNLKKTITSVSGNVGHVVAVAEELTASSVQTQMAAEQIAVSISELALGSEEQVRSSDEVVATAEEIYKGMKNISNNVQTVTNYSIQTYNKVEQGNEVIVKAVEQMQNINDKILYSSKTVDLLGSKSSEIGNIVSLITSVAEQTNMLALNAAIESARAGEHGKGFAVVAEEVRKLAEQSANSAGKISRLISEIQSEILRAIEAMDDGNSAVKLGTDMVGNVGDYFKGILSEVNGVSVQIQEVSFVVKEITEGTNKLVDVINKITSISKETAAGTQNIAASAEEQDAIMRETLEVAKKLSSAAINLGENISMFKI